MNTRLIPYGYKMENGVLLVNDEETVQIRRIFEMRISGMEDRIKEINEKLADIETERERILAAISGSTFEHMSDELKALNRQESEYARQLEELREQQNDHRRNLLREESARKLLKDLKPLTEFDDNLLGRILAKIDAISKNKITVTFCGGYTVTQEIE